MRLIDADALMPNAEYKGANDFVSAYNIVNAPTIDPIKHGRWINGICSECGKKAVWRVAMRGEVVWEDVYTFCPHCGAYMMDGDENG